MGQRQFGEEFLFRAIPEHLKEQSYADFRPNRKMVIPRPIKINMIRTAKS
jgi:hypothetical protein